MESREKTFKALEAEAGNCRKCGLWKSRSNVVFGAGCSSARVLFLGEAPGYNEDKKGIPFCGKAGGVLDILLSSVNLKREQVYITNIIKCRPPSNRDPEKDEAEACRGYLEKQLEIINPDVICTLGRHALGYVLRRYVPGQTGTISSLHGRVFEHAEDMFSRRSIVALYHPAVAVYDPGRLGLLKKDFGVIADLL